MARIDVHPIFDNFSFADYLQFCGAMAIENSNGPKRLTLNTFAYHILPHGFVAGAARTLVPTKIRWGRSATAGARRNIRNG